MGFSEFMVFFFFFLVATFYLPEIGICISLIVLLLVLLVGSFMGLDAAWHECVLIALAVLIVGVLAVSAQCGCCHHSLPYFSNMPFQVCFLWLHFFSSLGLHPVCCMYYSFLTSILHILLLGLLFVFCVLFLFLVITWCICCGDYGIYLVGGLILLFMYHHLFVCSLWSFSCVFLHFFSYVFVCLFLYSHVPLVFLLVHLYVFYSCLDENFWGVYAYVSYAAIYVFGNMHA